ncbi:MAG: nitronate monooxygenase [Spongiibacteraceae bacterium]
MALAQALLDLRLPILQAPMFLVSSNQLAQACCEAGLIGAFQLANPRTLEDLEQWLHGLREVADTRRAAGQRFAPFCVNVNADGTDKPGFAESVYGQKVALVERERVPLILSSIGNPAALVERAHAWGGRVIHDVTTMRFAQKAIDAGVDGLMLTCAGAGGHNGSLSPFAFLPQIRRQFDGLIVLAGGIADAAGIRGALALGADMVCLGTRFVATKESAAPQAYKDMVVASQTSDILESDAIAGLTANWLKPSIVAQGLDPANLPPPQQRHRPNLPEGVRAWKNVWSAGHSTGLVDDIPTVAALAERFVAELDGALQPGWQAHIAARLRV